jgi:NAD(P)-dependent dehydrogenase (short-subunit alcohol dehydrogenase family)
MFDYRSMFDLTGKTALVIGAGSGIGEAGAHGLSAFGATVFCADVNAAAAERTAEESRSQGWQAESVELDMTDPDSVRAAAERVGTPEVLVSTPSVRPRSKRAPIGTAPTRPKASSAAGPSPTRWWA